MRGKKKYQRGKIKNPKTTTATTIKNIYIPMEDSSLALSKSSRRPWRMTLSLLDSKLLDVTRILLLNLSPVFIKSKTSFVLINND